ncbi:uncharacterized protein LOC129947183 isoform X2 [Eupeodes corollae]|uniref:uncharacterized protein LOC129947183 isoform X2 n=1 Tax=Eupeodes corollae TaxID=290404 RepID=UPI002491BEF5|nr:uncharacterized protein LOC129947183 isoform X2 [Eupeodes corollae]
MISNLNFCKPSLKRIQKDEEQNEPFTKTRKKSSKFNKIKVCYIFSLPNDILEKIVGYIPYWHLPRLRKSCKRLLGVCDAVLLHEFKTSLHDYSLKDPEGIEYASLMAIKDATWPYIFYGYESIFCGTILPIIWNNNNFYPEPDKIKSFLKHFYKSANNKCGKPNSQPSRLLYCITLMGLLKKLKNSRLLSISSIAPNYWRFVLELRGPWIGVLSTPKSAVEPHERAKLLMMLCEILIANRTNRALKVWECDSEVFIFGTNSSEEKKKPTMVVTFKISASKKITRLLKSFLEDELVQFPVSLPRGEFAVAIDVTCKEATKWGCCQVHHIEIGPQFDAHFEYEEDESDENNKSEFDV